MSWASTPPNPKLESADNGGNASHRTESPNLAVLLHYRLAFDPVRRDNDGRTLDWLRD